MVSPVTLQSVDNLQLAPLGAGDLIDRAIRLYRTHFLTLLRIAALPVVFSAIGGVMGTIGWREVSITSSSVSLAIYVVMICLGVVLSWGGLLFQVIVMGGATRNLITHLLWGAPVTARTTYRNVKMRFWGLVLAAILIGFAFLVVSLVLLAVFYVGFLILVIGGIAMYQILPEWAVWILAVVAFVVLLLLVLALFFFLMGHLAYLPQVMLVEGKGVFDAIGRSFSLARGHVKRLMAMAIFSLMAGYSALMLMIVPLGLYGYVNGINPFAFANAEAPAWYAIGYTVLTQVSSIIIAPIWMLGLSLLYVDQRVRREGYDLEVMAARQLGEMPALRTVSDAVYTPALALHQSDSTLVENTHKGSSVLGLQ
ncbi:MAG: hypothetical protein QOH96_1684 [Blastocatellia bacterium]|jgi:hypothetical protein|nr:hypothetical protein [Blastocatellia bacterium]